MPKQETYLEQQVGLRTIVVLKTYDAAFAHEAFERVPENALRFLLKSLGTPEDLEVGAEIDTDALWEEVQDGAREDWNTFSYFVVREDVGSHSVSLYVSSDWPSAEAFAKQHIAN